ncbi:hypothetical protein AAVH_26633 [Aphelenchoides avenae]|nr:hypothetical protein AAVH_26633 [Aphelenchus avenae]
MRRVRGTYVELSLRSDVTKETVRAQSAEFFQEFEQLNKTVKYLVGKKFPSLVGALKNPPKDEYDYPDSSKRALKIDDISNYFGDTFYKGLSSDEQDALNRHIDDIKNGWVHLDYGHLKNVLEYSNHLIHLKLNQAEDKFERLVRSIGNKNASDFLELVGTVTMY